MSYENIFYYFMGVLIFAAVFLSGIGMNYFGASDETSVDVTQGHALVELNSSEYLRYQQFVDCLISSGEVLVVSDIENLQLSVPQKNAAVFLNIKHSQQVSISELPCGFMSQLVLLSSLS